MIFDLWNTLISANGFRLVRRLASLIADEGEEDLSDVEEEVIDYLRATGCLHKGTDIRDIARDLWQFRRGVGAPNDFSRKVSKARDEFVDGCGYIQGAQEILAALTSDGWNVGVVSNATTVSIEVVERLGLTAQVADVWLSCESGFLKPDPRAFLAVASEWGVAPEEIVVVGDKIGTDVLGARLCKMEAIWFAAHLSATHEDTHSSVLAVVNRLSDVKPILDRWASGPSIEEFRDERDPKEQIRS